MKIWTESGQQKDVRKSWTKEIWTKVFVGRDVSTNSFKRMDKMWT